MPYINVDEAYILDNTGLQVDQVVDIPYTDAALTDTQKAQARKNIEAGGTNPNLLDNPFFTVNQRSLTTYALTGNAYFVDRWKSSGGNTITVSTDGISMVPGTGTHQNLIQANPIIGNLLGRTLTASVMSQTGEISSVTFTLPSSISSGTLYDGGSVTVDNVGLKVYIANTYSGLPSGYAFWLYSSSTAQTVNYRAVKLELGTVSTLLNDTPPNYAEELAKCQHYFVRLNMNANRCYGVGFAESTTSVRVNVPIPTTMRTDPSITTSGTIRLKGNGGVFAPTAYSVQSDAHTGAVSLSITVSGATQYAIYALSANDAAYIDLSADL